MKTLLWRALAASLLCLTLGACSDDNNNNNDAMDMGTDSRLLDDDPIDQLPEDGGLFPDTDPNPNLNDAATINDTGATPEDMGNEEDVGASDTGGEDGGLGDTDIADMDIPDVRVDMM